MCGPGTSTDDAVSFHLLVEVVQLTPPVCNQDHRPVRSRPPPAAIAARLSATERAGRAGCACCDAPRAALHLTSRADTHVPIPHESRIAREVALVVVACRRAVGGRGARRVAVVDLRALISSRLQHINRARRTSVCKSRLISAVAASLSPRSSAYASTVLEQRHTAGSSTGFAPVTVIVCAGITVQTFAGSCRLRLRRRAAMMGWRDASTIVAVIATRVNTASFIFSGRSSSVMQSIAAKRARTSNNERESVKMSVG